MSFNGPDLFHTFKWSDRWEVAHVPLVRVNVSPVEIFLKHDLGFTCNAEVLLPQPYE